MKSFFMRVPIKRFMIGHLVVLFLLSAIALEAYERIGWGIVIVLSYVFFDLVWTYGRKRLWYVPLSSVISGLILALVADPLLSWQLAALLSFFAVLSKQTVHLQKIRHIINPAAFALLIGSLFFEAYPSWWGVSWIIHGSAPYLALIAGGLYILWRQKRFHVALPFFLIYGLYFGSFVFDPTVIFFVTVMLIEPVTSAFPLYKHRVLYGALTGIFAICVALLQSSTGRLGAMDPLIIALVTANIVTGILFLPKARI